MKKFSLKFSRYEIFNDTDPCRFGSAAVLLYRKRDPMLRIHMFLVLLDPDPSVRSMDPDPAPSITKQN
jgi:hypothetical protein